MVPVKQIKNMSLGDYIIASSNPEDLNFAYVVKEPPNANSLQTVSSNLLINGSFGAGTDISTLAKNTIALGVSAIASEPNTFVWNGVSSELYCPRHGQGSFNINTTDGIKSIYIGDQSLYDIVQNIALSLKYS